MTRPIAFVAALLLGLVSLTPMAQAQSYTFTTLNYPSVPGNTYACDINNSGQVVGYYGANQGFIYSGGSFSTISDPSSPGVFMEALGINNNSQITGGVDPQSFVYSGGSFSY